MKRIAMSLVAVVLLALVVGVGINVAQYGVWKGAECVEKFDNQGVAVTVVWLTKPQSGRCK